MNTITAGLMSRWHSYRLLLSGDITTKALAGAGLHLPATHQTMHAQPSPGQRSYSAAHCWRYQSYSFAWGMNKALESILSHLETCT